jgi:hypothetical protein
MGEWAESRMTPRQTPTPIRCTATLTPEQPEYREACKEVWAIFEGSYRTAHQRAYLDSITADEYCDELITLQEATDKGAY